MPGIKPVHWKTLECIFLKFGFVLSRHEGTSHRCYHKDGVKRPVIIPTYKEVGLDIIKRNMRTANMSNDDYFRLLAECK